MTEISLNTKDITPEPFSITQGQVFQVLHDDGLTILVMVTDCNEVIILTGNEAGETQDMNYYYLSRETLVNTLELTATLLPI